MAAQEFYGPLLDWSFEPPREQPPGFVVAEAQGVQVAGIGRLPPHERFPATWTTFFGVADVDAALRRVRERMGTVGVGPLDAWAGRVALATDPDGAVFGLWQGTGGPARRLPLPGAPTWVELSTDAFAAAMFYGDVLDWAAHDPGHLDMAWEHERVVLRVEGRGVAALRTADDYTASLPVRPHWHLSFAVDDLHRAVVQALRTGAGLVSAPAATPYGETAELHDPEGAPFSLVSARH
ncbi:VOC family protein [Streptacidiphilus sp. 4-A2]|nr:VOC family protein [Streptacidiphilus sp. 4-A2]